MTDTELSRWIVERVFEEKWHEVCDIANIGLYHDGYCIVESECTCGETRSTIWKYDDGDYVRLIEDEFHDINEHIAVFNPNLCTPDGKALLKAKAIELGVWDEFAWWHDEGITWSILYDGDNEVYALANAEILTTPRLFAEAFRAFWIERGK